MQAWTSPRVPAIPGHGPALRLHDTAARATVEVDPPREASLYVCGITPYDATHLGHANTYVAFDLLGRYWRDRGLDVTYVQNVTDIDDPLLERADATGVDWRDLAEEQVELFRQDMQALRVLAPEHFTGAVEAIPQIAAGVRELLDRGVAYRVQGQDGEPDGDVYFDSAAAASDVWRLGDESHLDPASMLALSAERGGDPERPGKRDPLDPLLWRVERPGEPSWDGGELGAGRPGWHVECSVIAMDSVDGPLTVQAGGSDLIFPHHEFSAGHAAALSGRPLADHFAHAGMVGLEGTKMSKSLGNLVLVSRLRQEGVDPMAVRLVLLDHHYRTDWSFEYPMLDDAARRLSSYAQAARTTSREEAQEALAGVREALADDLDAPRALEALDRWATAEPDAAGTGDGESLIRDGIDALLGIELPAQA